MVERDTSEYVRTELPLVMPDDKEIVKWDDRVHGHDPLTGELFGGDYPMHRPGRFGRRRAM